MLNNCSTVESRGVDSAEEEERRANEAGPHGAALRQRRWVSLLVVLFATWFATLQLAQAQQPAQTGNEKVANVGARAQSTVSSPAMPLENDARYRIGPGDVLDIRVFNRTNLSREAVRVEGNR